MYFHMLCLHVRARHRDERLLREKQREGDAVRYVFDVWVENELREKVVVGTASALVPAEVDAR